MKVGKKGLWDVEFNEVLDNYLEYGIIRADDYYKLNKDQENIIQAIKRSKRRLEYKHKTI